MKNVFIVSKLFFVSLFLVGCEKFPSANEAKFTVITDGKGKVIRLNTSTGETCIVGDNCDADLSGLVMGESYIYKGNGKFQLQKAIKWKDLK